MKSNKAITYCNTPEKEKRINDALAHLEKHDIISDTVSHFDLNDEETMVLIHEHLCRMDDEDA